MSKTSGSNPKVTKKTTATTKSTANLNPKATEKPPMKKGGKC